MTLPKVKEHFTSRWGNEGVLIEADWSQLELIGWAFLTKDPVLYKLIKSGQDVHRFVGGMVLGCKPEEIDDATRKALKARNFLLVYGGSAWELVRTHGMTEADANKLYETFWNLFPTAKLWQDNICKSVESTRKPIEETTPLGQQREIGYYRSITGRRYCFKTYDESEYQRKKGKFTKFKRPEMVNYPVQGFCTADIHMIAMGMLFREAIKHRDKFVLINTIHDSVLLDCKDIYSTETCILVKNVLLLVIERLKDIWDIKLDLPLNMEFKIGKNWANMKKHEVINGESIRSK